MVKSLLALLNTRQNSILSGAVILMVAVFGSKILGLVKDRFLVHNFDTSEAAIFFGAFRLPDLIFQLLIFGTLSVAFIPVFTCLYNFRDFSFYICSCIKQFAGAWVFRAAKIND